jgi:integrase
MVDLMQIDLPGLLRERMASGAYRWRVRTEKDKAKRIPLAVTPDHPAFMEHYRAARAGVKLEAPDPAPGALVQSFGWLTYQFSDHMAGLVRAGLMDARTAKQRSAFYARLRVDHGDKAIDMPRHKLIEIRDGMNATPGAADNMVKAVRAMYAWAIDRGLAQENPAVAIGKINRGTGATPWTVEDLKQFRDRHPQGTMAHLALSLFMFVACRLEDAPRLGRGNEVKRGGVTFISFKPGKLGSSQVSVPMVPPLAKAIATQVIVGPTYLLNGHGKPFASGAAFGNKFRDWVREAGLTDRSPHGIRKAAGHFMAQSGVNQHGIMSVHGHSEARTSEVYTAGVDREKLAVEAMRAMAGLEW